MSDENAISEFAKVECRSYGEWPDTIAGRALGALARAHHIEVDQCDDDRAPCPFSRPETCPETRIIDRFISCSHPLAAEHDCELLPTRAEPPDWCPLRGAVTIIAGPSSL